MAEEAHRRYAEIMLDVERMIDDHIAHQTTFTHNQSKLKLLVPSVGTFFTRLPLADAFRYQDKKRFISSRRFVPPSFNDVRLILNTAQLMGIVEAGGVELATFDGDVTLYVPNSSDLLNLPQIFEINEILDRYDDGKSLEKENPVIERIICECFLSSPPVILLSTS